MQPETACVEKFMNKFQLSIQKTIHILPTAKKYLTEMR